MKYPLMPDQTVEYLVLHALESRMVDVWGIRKHLLLRGPDYMLWPRQISRAHQGVWHTVNFSCAFARGFDLIHRKDGEEAQLMRSNAEVTGA